MGDIGKFTARLMYEALTPAFVKDAYSALAQSHTLVSTAESQSLDALQKESQKQKISMEFQAHQARVAQELAIAERITSSNEVEIEEYYEGAGKGQAGVMANADGGSIGMSGEGRRVTKRVVRFGGFNKPLTSEAEE